MSETKSFEELFLSENKDENLSIKELDILLVTDIHKNYAYLEKLKEWQIENKKLIDYIFCTGDILSLSYPENESLEIIAKSEAEISAIISFLENMSLNVIYLGGNHDPKSLFDSEKLPSLTMRSTNLHKKYKKLANDLYLVGLGGSVPAITSQHYVDDKDFIPYIDVKDEIIWQGYPYNFPRENPNYKSSDDIFMNDLNDAWNISRKEIEENNTTPEKSFILLTHCGPFYSSTSVQESKGRCVYMGSIKLNEFLKQNRDIFINIHGHTHQGIGINNFDRLSVINPGSLSIGNFAVMKVKRNFYDKWEISKLEFLKF
jgi:Icc-related predicted phosphoesterase